MNESSPGQRMQYPDPSQAGLWDSAAAAAVRARANLREQPEIINATGVNRDAEQIVEDESVRAAIPDSAEGALSTGEVRVARHQVVDSHLKAGRITTQAEVESAPGWAINPTDEQHRVEAPTTTNAGSEADVSPSEDPWRGATTGETELLNPEDITTGRGPRAIPPNVGADLGSSPWAGGHGKFSTVQSPPGYTGRRRR